MNKGKKIALASGGFLLVFAASAATAFFAVPQNVNYIDLRDPDGGNVEHTLTYSERFVNNLAESAGAGLHVEINKLVFDQYYVGENAKSGHNTISVDEVHPATFDFALNELNLHGINFALTAPLIYSNNGKDAKYRDVHASLVNDMIYLNLADRGNAETIGEERSEGGSWDFKYKISTEAYETTIDGKSEDDVTRGTYQYEYGKLDWLISDILEILSDGGISVSFEGWLDKLTGSKGEESSTKEEEEGSSIDTNAILDSLNNMVNVGGEDGTAYFVWNLPLGEKTISLGLGGNEQAILTSVDLPAKYNLDGTPSAESAWEIQEGMSLSLSATVGSELSKDGTKIDWASTIYGDPAEYRDLANSAALFENVARLVAKPEIGLVGDFYIGHVEESVTGTRTILKKEGVDETAHLHLDANIDAYKESEEEGKLVKKRALEGIDANISIDKVRESEEFKGHQIGVAYLEEENGFQGYLNVNDVLKAKTSKTYLDEFYTNVLKDAFSGSKEEKMDLSKITKLLGKLGEEIDKILNSNLVKGIQDGTYVSALDLISLLRGADNLIEIDLSLAPLGISGEVIVKISGEEDASLASVEIRGVKLASITLDGSLKTSAFHAPSAPEFGSDKEYETLTHLKGIGGQIKAIADDKSFQAELSGNVYQEDGSSKKLEIGGEVAFDFEKEGEEGEDPIKEGRVNLGLTHFAESYVEDHNIKLGVLDDFKKVAFSYDSLSTSGKATVSQKKEKGIEGILDLNAAKEIFSEDNGFSLDFLLSFFRGEDRFSRLGASLMGESSSSLLNSILDGNYFDLLENRHIISDISLGATTDIVINGDALGLEETTINLSLAYDSVSSFGGDEEGEGAEKGLSAISVTMFKGTNKTFDLTISNIDTLKGASASAFNSTEGFIDFTPLANVGQELLNTLTMGVVENEEGKLDGISYYGVEGAIDLEIAGYGTNLYDFDLHASVEGAETKLMADFSDLPVIRGINAPDNERYFRPNELEGIRDSKLYYYANGVNPEGEFLLTRNSSYGRIKDVQDAVRLSGKDYMSDLLGWVVEYSLGVNESFFEKEEESEATVEESEESAKKGLFDEKGIHFADAFVGFEASDVTMGKEYTFTLDLGNLLGIGVLGNVDLTLKSTDLKSDNGFAARCLTGLEATVDASATAKNDGSKLHFAKANVSLELTNFAADGSILSENGVDSEYAEYFVGEVADSGLLDEASKGKLFDLKNGFQSDDKNDEFYALYGYNYVGLDEIPEGRNLYLGLN